MYLQMIAQRILAADYYESDEIDTNSNSIELWMTKNNFLLKSDTYKALKIAGFETMYVVLACLP